MQWMESYCCLLQLLLQFILHLCKWLFCYSANNAHTLNPDAILPPSRRMSAIGVCVSRQGLPDLYSAQVQSIQENSSAVVLQRFFSAGLQTIEVRLCDLSPLEWPNVYNIETDHLYQLVRVGVYTTDKPCLNTLHLTYLNALMFLLTYSTRASISHYLVSLCEMARTQWT